MKKNISTVLVCASYEYLEDLYGAQSIDDVDLDLWLEEVIKKWQGLCEDIFKAKIHYDSYVNAGQGKINGINFLKNEIAQF